MRKLCGRADAALKITITQNTRTYVVFGRGHRRRDEAHALCTGAPENAHHVYAVYYYYYYYDPSPPPQSRTRTRALAVRTPRNDRPGRAIFRGRSEKQTHARVEFFDFSRLVPTPTPVAAATAATAEKYFTGDAAAAGSSDNNNYTCKARNTRRRIRFPYRCHCRDTCGRHLHTMRTLYSSVRRTLVCFFDFRVNITSELVVAGRGRGGGKDRNLHRIVIGCIVLFIPRKPHIVSVLSGGFSVVDGNLFK